ncbi:MAG: hypothetical protein JWP34_4940 [Massilia sp.]|nr:hypothetical protein [Massilia sp.]
MRINTFDLTSFGSFTNMSLNLSAPGVHIITGPNEAGKSTALHALGQLLYGIDARSEYDFVHPKSALRLGALLQRADGSVLEIIRTKSTKTPLVGRDGSPINEAELTAVLGGIDRQTFTSEFALTSRELRLGGQSLVAGNGDLGQALAASRSGLSLTLTQQAIETRMAELYKRTGTKPRINVRIKTLKEAQERKRQASLRPENYITQEREVERARAELDQLADELRALRRDHSKLERLDQALPALARRRGLLTEIEEILAAGVLAAGDVAERLPELMREARDAERLTEAAKNRIDVLDRELAELAVDEVLLAHTDEIEALSQDRKAAEEAAQLLARSAGTAASLRAEAAELLAQVHPTAALDDPHLYRVSEAVRSRARELHDQRTVIDAGLDQSRRARADRRRKLDQAERRLDGMPPVPDSQPLQGALAAIPPDLLTRMATAEETEHKHRGRAGRILGELKLAALSEPVAVPTHQQVTEQVEAIRQLKRDRRELTKRTKELAGRLQERRLELTALLKHDPPPTGEDLLAARTTRDALWAGLGRPVATETGEQYERAVEHADLIADRMFQNAERISARLHLELDISKGDQELTTHAEESGELDRQATELETEWARLWGDYCGAVPRPEAATATLDAVRGLRETLRELGDAESTLSVLRAQAVQHVTRLKDLLDDPADLVAENVLSELPELREIAEARLADQAAAAGDRSVAEERVTAERTELAEAEALLTQHEEQLAEWTAGWQQALDEAGLPAGQDPVGALADLDRLGQVVDKLSEADRTERTSGQAADLVERFNDTLIRVVDSCGRPMPEDQADRYRLSSTLHAEAKRNRSQADDRDRLHHEQERHQIDLDGAIEVARQQATELTVLVTRTGVDSIEALDAAVRRQGRHTELTTKLSDLTQTITLGSQTLDQLMDEALRTDPDQLKAELAELSEHITDLETRRIEQTELFMSRKTDLDRLDGSALAAQAAAEAEVASAELVEETEEYLRLEVARTILHSHIEQYRNAQQDPVLERAGRLFRELTLHRFSGLQLEQEGDSPVVLARRDTEELLHARQLSEATADQLYLALRLASLERYADEDRGLPFTIDDIFMTFDNDRTRAALKVLDEMADRFQMIVFTHHDHLVGLAREVLPQGRLHVHELPEFVPVGRAVVPQPRGERSCRSCGAALAYSGRGRPPVECADCQGER